MMCEASSTISESSRARTKAGYVEKEKKEKVTIERITCEAIKSGRRKAGIRSIEKEEESPGRAVAVFIKLFS